MSTLNVRVVGTKGAVHACLEALEKKYPYKRLTFEWMGDCCHLDLTFEGRVTCDDITTFMQTQTETRCCGVYKKCCV